MKIRRWPITIVGGSLLFASIACTEDVPPPTEGGDSAITSTDTSADVADPTPDTQVPPPLDVQTQEDSELPPPDDTEDELDLGSVSDTDEGPWDVDEGPWDVDEGPWDVDEGPWDADEGPVDVDEGPWDVDEGPVDVDEGPVDASPLDIDDGPADAGTPQDTTETEGPKAGDACDHGMFDEAGIVCSDTDPPEIVLVCDGEKYVDPKDPNETVEAPFCDCYLDPATGEVEVICATPGFVGIAQAGKKREVTSRLRRI